MKLIVYYKKYTKKVEVPDDVTLESLRTLIKKTFPDTLQETDSHLKYWDQDVDEFLDLEDITDIYDKCKIQVISDWSPGAQGADPSLETPSKTGHSTNPAVPDSSCTAQWRQRAWPARYELPIARFSMRLTESLRKREPLNFKNKQELINVLGDDIYKITPYPTGKQLNEVACLLVTVYTHLREVLGSGHDAWKQTFENKMKKLRQDMKDTAEVKRNAATKRGKNNKLVGPGRKASRAQKGEINWAPDVAEGEDETSLEHHANFLSKEMKKPHHLRNSAKIKAAMDATYPLRRAFINDGPPLCDIKDRFPALFTTSEITTEFGRLMPQYSLSATMTTRMLALGVTIVECMSGLKKAKTNRNFMAAVEGLQLSTEDDDERTKRLKYAVVAAAYLPLLFGEELELVKIAEVRK